MFLAAGVVDAFPCFPAAPRPACRPGLCEDKAAHAVAGAAAAAVATDITGSKAAGCATALALGAGKELWDARRGGDDEFLDFAATAAFGCGVTLAF